MHLSRRASRRLLVVAAVGVSLGAGRKRGTRAARRRTDDERWGDGQAAGPHSGGSGERPGSVRAWRGEPGERGERGEGVE